MNEKQTKYIRKGSDQYQTTYTSWNLSLDDQDAQEKLSYPPRVGMCMAFLRVNRECYKLGTEALYSRGLRFDSSPSTCLAFLHDHQRKEHRISPITIRYDESSTCYVWQRLFNTLVHSRTDLTSLTVKISARFWKIAPWSTKRTFLPCLSLEETAKRVVVWKVWCSINGAACCGERTFLAHVARLPLKNNGQDLLVNIEIEGSEVEQPRKDLVKALNLDIERRRVDRPSIAEASYKVCQTDKLERSCYWDKETLCRRLFQ